VRLYLPLFILMGLYTGARKEALLSLRWSQVDFAPGRINFNPPSARVTNKRRARIPIPTRASIAGRDHRRPRAGADFMPLRKLSSRYPSSSGRGRSDLSRSGRRGASRHVDA